MLHNYNTVFLNNFTKFLIILTNKNFKIVPFEPNHKLHLG